MTDEHYRLTLSMIQDLHNLLGELIRVLPGTNATPQQVGAFHDYLRLAGQRVRDEIVLADEAK